MGDLFDNLNTFINADPPDIEDIDNDISIETSLDMTDDDIVTPSPRRGNKISVTLTPGKGQKSAIKRLEKIKQQLAISENSFTSEECEAPSARTRSRIKKQITPPTQIRQKFRKFTPVSPIDFVDLDDDIDIIENTQSQNNFESENHELFLNIRWKSKRDKISYRKHQTFADLINKLAVEENTEPKFIFLNLDDKIINANDTPASIGYAIGNIISGRLIKDTNFVNTGAKSRSKTSINVKIQSGMWKKPLIITMEKTNTMKILVIKCAEELKCLPQSLKLQFDGESLDLNATPEDLDFEGGEMLDLRIVE